MNASGYNPLRWDCEQRGCFNVHGRPKIEVFAECFPGKISFGDIDGISEIVGNALMLEWKQRPTTLNRGQAIMHQRLTKGRRITVLYVAGDPKTMNATHRAWFWDGQWRAWRPTTLSDVKVWIRAWVKWAYTNPKFGARS